MHTVSKSRRAYWICFTPRTGSALLCQLLRATGVAGRPEEYFWRDNEPLYRAQWHVTIVYEDFITDHAGTVAHILRYLEVSDPYVLDATAITLARQADSLSEAWVQQYREEKQRHWPNRAW